MTAPVSLKRFCRPSIWPRLTLLGSASLCNASAAHANLEVTDARDIDLTRGVSEAGAAEITEITERWKRPPRKVGRRFTLLHVPGPIFAYYTRLAGPLT
jgi:hypothetical protein